MMPTNALGTGLPGSLRALGATFLALVCARAELIAIELQEERVRAGQKLVLVVLAAMFLAMGLLLAAFLVVVLSWETHRMLAAGGVTLLYLGIGGWALVRLREMSRNSPPPFAATMSEFANDLRLLRGRDE
jgi:Predicted membrane protein